jgi:PPM family protein phosphatase
MFWKKRNKNKTGNQETGTAPEPAEPSNLKVVIKTDLGNVRTNNEDAASFFRMNDENIIREKGYLLIVADGMGGHAAGEVASNMAVEIISQEYYKDTKENNTEKILAKAFNTANKKIFDLASANEKYRGMGTTCTALAVVGQTIYFAHAGDSRAYLYKDKTITQITEDHTYVQQLVKDGSITAHEAETHPQRNILTNAMGTKPDMRVDTGKYTEPLADHDRLMICSDGLYDYLTNDELAEIMSMEVLDNVADYFIAEAKARGGKDNITVALAEKMEEKIEPLQETNLKLTRDVELPKLTRDADLPY